MWRLDGVEGKVVRVGEVSVSMRRLAIMMRWTVLMKRVLMMKGCRYAGSGCASLRHQVEL